MSRTTRRFFSASAAALGITFFSLFSSLASAASISYGNFGPVPPGFSFLNVTESSGTDAVPLYGPPTPFSVGLDFMPPAFGATAGSPGADLTDGQLNFTVMGPSITNIIVLEGGVYTLGGVGTIATQVTAAASVRATITQVNGVDVAPINAGFSSAAAGFNLLTNAGANQPWSVGVSLNVAGVLAAGQVATKVDVTIDNQLFAVNELQSQASIQKNSFRITTPEPASFALGALALCGAGLATRKRRV
jgi:hypothetical protein